jgi:methionine-rich copper-binding protein CopC
MKLSRTGVASGAAIFAVLLASHAWAHASARTSTPEDGAVLSESPTEVVINFGGPAKLLSLTISAADGDPLSIDISNATSVDGRVSVAILPLAPNSYAVVWRAMGVDGHITSGKFKFDVSSPS